MVAEVVVREMERLLEQAALLFAILRVVEGPVEESAECLEAHIGTVAWNALEVLLQTPREGLLGSQKS